MRVSQQIVAAWLARICCDAAPDFAKTFEKRADAEDWARVKEGELAGRQFTDHRMADQITLATLLKRLDESVLSARPLHHLDGLRFCQLNALPLAQARVSSLTSGQIASYRDGHKKQVKRATVKIELELISHVIARAMRG